VGAKKDALMQMTFDDARKILTGGETSATGYFKSKTSEKPSSTFRPAVESAMADTGVVKAVQANRWRNWRPCLSSSVPVSISRNLFSERRCGLFYMRGQEEKKIRTNPAAQIPPLLKEKYSASIKLTNRCFR
jgi:hypothetical protein